MPLQETCAITVPSVSTSGLLRMGLPEGRLPEVHVPPAGGAAYRVAARYRPDPRAVLGWWERLFFPAVVVNRIRRG